VVDFSAPATLREHEYIYTQIVPNGQEKQLFLKRRKRLLPENKKIFTRNFFAFLFFTFPRVPQRFRAFHELSFPRRQEKSCAKKLFGLFHETWQS